MDSPDVSGSKEHDSSSKRRKVETLEHFKECDTRRDEDADDFDRRRRQSKSRKSSSPQQVRTRKSVSPVQVKSRKSRKGDRERDRDGEKEKEKEKEKSRDKERDRDRDRDKEKDRDKERERERDRDRDKGKVRDRESSLPGKRNDVEDRPENVFECPENEKVASRKKMDRHEGSGDESEGKRMSKKKNGSKSKRVPKPGKGGRDDYYENVGKVAKDIKEGDEHTAALERDNVSSKKVSEALMRKGTHKAIEEVDSRRVGNGPELSDGERHHKNDPLDAKVSSFENSKSRGRNKGERSKEVELESSKSRTKEVDLEFSKTRTVDKDEPETVKGLTKKRGLKERTRDRDEKAEKHELDQDGREQAAWHEFDVLDQEGKEQAMWEESEEMRGGRSGDDKGAKKSKKSKKSKDKNLSRGRRGSVLEEEHRSLGKERLWGPWDESEDASKSAPRTRRDEGRFEEVKSERYKERLEVRWEESEDGSKLALRGRREEETSEKHRARDRADSGGREDLIEGSRPGRARGGRSGKGSWSPDGRSGGAQGDWEEYDRDLSDDREEFERERTGARRAGYDRERDWHRERLREKNYDWGWERERGRDWEETGDRRKGRYQEKHKERDGKGREGEFEVDIDEWEMDRRWEKADRGRMERESTDRDVADRERKERDRSDAFRSPQKMAIHGESSARSGGAGSGGKMGQGGQTANSYMSWGDHAFQNDFQGGHGETKWDGHVQDERMRMSDAIYVAGTDPRERYNMGDDEGPPGMDQGFGSGKGGSDGMYFHGGRGRSHKGSPGSRGRGGMMGPDGRPYISNQGPGAVPRGMQQGGKGGRGGRGRGVKGGRSGRECQRSNGMPPIMGPGSGAGPGMGPGPGPGSAPGMSPHFGHLGPPSGPLPVMGPAVGPVAGPGMGPGGFHIPPFGGPIGWGMGRAVGGMNMLGGPSNPAAVPPTASSAGPGLSPGSVPRFNSSMAPGPAPNKFYNQPALGRGVPNGGPGGMFPGGQYAGRGMPLERAPSAGRGMLRTTAPAGRGPSRGEQNDYSQHFVDTGLRPQNFIRDVELADRFEEYPKLKELISRKDKLIADHATPPMYMHCDLRTTELSPELFGTKFDVILVDPPWEEYVRRAPGVGDSMEWWTFEEILNLRIEAIADTPSFIFLWVGDAEGLDQGRLCLKKWGFRRCEDICWVKTNKENPSPALRHDANTLFQHSKEHCLMGIKGTVRRSTDGHIIHANVDTDVIISEEPPYGTVTKPEELYHIIEHFALGQRRLELFGEDHNIRAGWVTIGKGLTSSNYNSQTYSKYYSDAEGKVWQGGRGNPPVDAPHLVGTTPEIEALRPKSPPPRPQQPPQSQAANSASQPSAVTSSNKKPTVAASPVVPQDGQVAPSNAGQVVPVESSASVVPAVTVVDVVAGADPSSSMVQNPKVAQCSFAGSSVTTPAAASIHDGEKLDKDTSDYSGKDTVELPKETTGTQGETPMEVVESTPNGSISDVGRPE